MALYGTLVGHAAVAFGAGVDDAADTNPRGAIPIRVELSGTRDCPSSDEFVETIVERTTHARPATSGEMAWSLEVFVESKGRSRLAQLLMRSTEGPWVKREVVAPNCRQALDALSLVIAILVETAAEQADSLAEQARRKGEEPRTLAPLPEVAVGVWIPWIDDPHFFEDRGVQPVEVSGSFSGLFGVELDQTLLPNTNVEYFAGLEWSRWQPDLISPSYAAMLTLGTGDVVRKGFGEARVSRGLLRALACPVDFIRSPTVDLHPCARLDGGVMWIHTARIEGGVSFEPTSARAFVAKGGPSLEFSVAPHPGIQLRLEFGIDTMLSRKTIDVEAYSGSFLLYRPKRNNGYAGLGVGIGL